MTIAHAHCRGLRLRSLSIALSVGLYWSPHAPAQTSVDEPPAVKADASLRSDVEECFRIQALRDTRDLTLVQVMIQVDQPPTAMGFNVSARAGDRTIPIGPMAWTTQIGWWAYDVDVSPDIKSLDFTFTPSAEAVTTLKRRSSMNAFRLKGLESIWTGEPVVVRSVKIRSQRLQGMMRIEPPNPAAAVTELGNLLEADDPIVEQFRRDGDAAAARRQLERSVQDHPEDAEAWFNLGCLTAAAGEWKPAVDCFVKVLRVEPGSPLTDKAQRQLRRIGSYWTYLARDGDADAMYGLGLMYQQGWGPKPDRQEAKRWLHNAADAGSVEATRQLELMREQDLAAEANAPEAPIPAAPASERDPMMTAVAPPVAPEEAAREYERWVEKFARRPLNGMKLAVIAVEGEDRPNKRPFESSVVTYGCTVAEGGELEHFSASDRGVKGSSGTSIGPADLERLDELLNSLPDDGARLPRAGRRVILQTARAGEPIARVYDRADMPKTVLEILRLSQSGIRAWLPTFAPESEIDARPHEHGGFLCLSPDKTQILFSSANGAIQRWEPTTHDPLGDIPRRQGMPMDTFAYNRNASLAALSGWGKCEVVDAKSWQRVLTFEEPVIEGRRNGLSNPRFTPDGRFLVVECSDLSLRVFDMTSGERVDRLPNLPGDTVRYFPAPQENLAVIQTKDRTLALWNLDQNKSVSALDQDGLLSEVSFSPDESVFAAVTNSDGRQTQIRLWRTQTGELLHELRPFEQSTCERARFLRWSPDGRYLLAATKSHSFFTSEGISVWNASTGRHRGEFTGCPTAVIGAELLPDGRRLVVGCQDGKIRFWDVSAAMKQIQAFENTLQDDALTPK